MCTIGLVACEETGSLCMNVTECVDDLRILLKHIGNSADLKGRWKPNTWLVALGARQTMVVSQDTLTLVVLQP